MQPNISAAGARHPVVSVICAVGLLSALVVSLAMCSNNDLVIPGSIPPTLIATPVATATPIGV